MESAAPDSSRIRRCCARPPTAVSMEFQSEAEVDEKKSVYKAKESMLPTALRAISMPSLKLQCGRTRCPVSYLLYALFAKNCGMDDHAKLAAFCIDNAYLAIQVPFDYRRVRYTPRCLALLAFVSYTIRI